MQPQFEWRICVCLLTRVSYVATVGVEICNFALTGILTNPAKKLGHIDLIKAQVLNGHCQ